MNIENGTEVKALESAAKAAKARYQREWCARNKERVKAYQIRYWERKALDAEQSNGEKNDGQTE